MPIVLAFTVKHHKNKVNPVVPKKLQFHEENEETFKIGEIPFHEDGEDSTSNDGNPKNENAKGVLTYPTENYEESSYLPGQICHI